MSNEGRRALVLSAISASLYGAWGALAQLSLLRGLSPGEVGAAIYLVSAAAAAVMAKRPWPPDPRWIASGLLFMIANFMLFSLMRLSSLASAYVYVPSSILVFFAMTAHGSAVTERPRVAASVSLVAVGMALAQVNGVHGFNVYGLAVGLAIAVLYGFATYLAYTSLRAGREAEENLWVMLTEAVAFLVPLALQERAAPSAGLIFLFVSGASVAAGFQLELRAYEVSEKTPRRLSLVNLVNAVTNLDIVVIILAAIALGSYSTYSVIALVLVFAGVTALYLE